MSRETLKILLDRLDAGGTLPIIVDDGTNTVVISQDSGALKLQNFLDVGGLLCQLILDADGTAYLQARDGEVVVSSIGGAVQDARLEAGGGDAYCRAQSSGGIKGAQLATGPHLAEIDDGTYSAPTFHVIAEQNIWEASGSMAPLASADLSDSQFGFWLDDTPGATKIMFKAKDSAGTVRTGSVALT